MHRFAVWAPNPARVDLVLDGRRLPMERDGRGWWTLVDDNAGAGTRYAYSLDGGPPRPDPRSFHQADGVHGPSQVVDHKAFMWRDHGWGGVLLAGSVLYELHVGTFSQTGTFDGVAEHLAHLVDLGVDAVELMPVNQFPGRRGWGYDGVDLFAPHHPYGGPDGLKRLVDSCHRAGLGVVIDVVYNHLGPTGNYLGEFGPYFSSRHMTNWGPAVNLDGPGSAEVRSFIIDNALMWLRDYHCDGLRLDAVHAMVDQSAVPVFEELAIEVEALAAHVRRPLFVVAENDLNDPRLVRSRDAGGFGLDAVWADEWHHALHAALSGERSGYYEDFGSLAALAKALSQAWVYDGTWSQHRRRFHGRPPTDLSGHRFVVFTQNHDQVGNRAGGERAGALMGPGRLKISAALLLGAPFTPMLFQGEEWGATTPFQYFTDHDDPELANAVSQGRRDEFAAFGWDPAEVPDPQDGATFERSKLAWSELERSEHGELLEWYRCLIDLRRRVPAWSDGRLDRAEVDFDEHEGWITHRRGPVSIALNLGPDTVRLPPSSTDHRLIMASDPGVALGEAGLTLPPDGMAVLEAAEHPAKVGRARVG